MARSLVIAMGLALALAAVPADAGGADEKQEAKERFEKGVVLFKEGDFVAALVEFRAAYAAVPHFSVRYNLGITLYQLHRYAEAQEEFVAFLSEGGDGIEASKRQEVEGFLADLESLVSTLTISCSHEGAQLFLNGTFEKDIGLKEELLLDVGEYSIEIRLEGFSTYYKKLEVPGGKVIHLDVALDSGKAATEPDEPEPVEPVVDAPSVIGDRGLSKAPLWSVLGLTVASGLTAAVLGGVFLAKRKDFVQAGAVTGWQDDRDELRRLALGADVMFGVTGALAVATIVLAVLTLRSGDEKADAGPGVGLVPVLATPGLVLGGTF